MRLSAGLHRLLDFCFPSSCAVCQEACEGDAPLCETCRIKLVSQESAAACEKCAMPIAESHAPCAYCQGAGVPHFEKIMRLGVFEDPLKHLIHQMKYHRAWGLAEFLADRLVDQERVKSLLMQTECIAAVPLYFTRHIARGYNQADLIARQVARKTGIRYVKPLKRLRATESQTNLAQAKRVENVRGAFGLIDSKSIRGRNVVLVDDVMTTGATLQSAARTMLRARTASLCAITIAVADPKGRGFEAI